MAWIEQNAVAVLGWIGLAVSFAFVFGKRLTKLEATDDSLGKAVEALTKSNRELNDAVAALAKDVNGHNGNLVLAKAIDALAASLSNLGVRSTDMEKRLQMHESKIERLDEMRTYLNEQFATLTMGQNEMKLALMRLEVQATVRERETNHGG